MSFWESTSKAVLINELFESDALYFEAGAECEAIEGAVVARMPGLESLAAGCVVQRIDLQLAASNPTRWLDGIEQHLSKLAASRVRLYTQFHNDSISNTLINRGYQPVDEVALLLHADSRQEVGNSVSLKPILDQDGWDKRLSIYHHTHKGPDGHVSPLEQWIELERRKCSAGYMLPFLIYKNADLCGAVNVAVHQHLVRLKNLAIHPNFRRQSCGTYAASLYAKLARDYNKPAAGCFAIDKQISLSMYQKAGYVPVAKQTEWLKDINHD